MLSCSKLVLPVFNSTDGTSHLGITTSDHLEGAVSIVVWIRVYVSF
jgi:hypothetical protein